MEGFICSLDAAMYMIGGKWKLFILWNLKDEKKRFNQLAKLIPRITQKMLTQQLRELERDKIVTRIVYPQIPLVFRNAFVMQVSLSPDTT